MPVPAIRKRSPLLVMSSRTSVVPGARSIVNWSTSKPKLFTKVGLRAPGVEMEPLSGLSTALAALDSGTPLAATCSGTMP